MNEPQEHQAEAALEAELALWKVDGLQPRFFLRDDDAVSNSVALRRLTDCCREHGAPLLLASIARDADASLGKLVRHDPGVLGAVHGYGHVSHSPRGEKPCELGAHRSLDVVLDELRRGRAKLEELFDGQLSGLLVPPWNRIDDGVRKHVGEAGFAGVSAHGWLDKPSSVASVNVHIDIIHWSAGVVGRQWEWVANELTRNLREARLRGGRAIGLLTHHRSHDEQAWQVLDKILAWRRKNTQISWVTADSLLTQPPEPIRSQ